MKNASNWIGSLVAVGLVVAAPSGVRAASDVKKAEHAVSGAAHRVSQSYHKGVKHYHQRRARHLAKKGHFGAAMRQEEKAESHSVAAQKQGHEAHVKEKALRHD